jgi:hypothetical protein
MIEFIGVSDIQKHIFSFSAKELLLFDKIAVIGLDNYVHIFKSKDKFINLLDPKLFVQNEVYPEKALRQIETLKKDNLIFDPFPYSINNNPRLSIVQEKELVSLTRQYEVLERNWRFYSNKINPVRIPNQRKMLSGANNIQRKINQKIYCMTLYTR